MNAMLAFVQIGGKMTLTENIKEMVKAQLNELSTTFLANYKTAAYKQASEIDKKPVLTPDENKKYNKRFKGISNATIKQSKNETKPV